MYSHDALICMYSWPEGKCKHIKAPKGDQPCPCYINNKYHLAWSDQRSPHSNKSDMLCTQGDQQYLQQHGPLVSVKPLMPIHILRYMCNAFHGVL